MDRGKMYYVWYSDFDNCRSLQLGQEFEKRYLIGRHKIRVYEEKVVETLDAQLEIWCLLVTPRREKWFTNLRNI